MKNLLKTLFYLPIVILMITMIGCEDFDLCGDDTYEYTHEKETREALFYTCDELSTTTPLYWLKVKYAGQSTITIYPTDTTHILRNVPKTANIELRAYYRKVNMYPEITMRSIGAPLAGGVQEPCWDIYANEQKESSTGDYCAAYLVETLKSPLRETAEVVVRAAGNYSEEIRIKLEYAE